MHDALIKAMFILNIFWVLVALGLNHFWYKTAMELNEEWADILDEKISEVEQYYTEGEEQDNEQSS